MELISQRYKILINHSEITTAYYIVDTWSKEEEQPNVVASWLENWGTELDKGMR